MKQTIISMYLCICAPGIYANIPIDQVLYQLRTDTDNDITAYASSITSILESLSPEERAQTEALITAILDPDATQTLAPQLKALIQVIMPQEKKDLLPAPNPHAEWYKQPTYPVQTPDEKREYTRQNSYLSVLQPIMWVFAGVIVILYIQSTRMPTYSDEENSLRFHEDNVIAPYEGLASAVEKKLRGSR